MFFNLLRPLKNKITLIDDKLAELKSEYELFLCEPFRLPKIVMIGGVGAGKSSVLEGLLERNLIPRGGDVMTRRPLVIKIVKTEDCAYGEFEHRPGVKFTKDYEMRREIESETLQECGKKKMLSMKPIYLTIYDERASEEITFVDLPGLSRIPREDQPENIEEITWRCCEEFIDENSIILAVVPANADLVNSEALKFIQEHEGLKERSLGILSKLDLMDEGCVSDELSNSRELFMFEELGWSGVVNRSVSDNRVNMSVEEAKRKELAFFENHPVYSRVNKDRNEMRLNSLTCGIDAVEEKLSLVKKTNKFAFLYYFYFN